MATRRYSKQRHFILETVRHNRVHPTADQVYQLLKKNHPQLSLGTVYRNLNLLSEEGLITAIPSRGGECFDGETAPHHHLQCEGCGGVFDLILDYEDSIESVAAQNPGFTITGMEVLFKGLCKNCAEKNKS